MRTLAGLIVSMTMLQAPPGTGSITGNVIKAGTTILQPLRNARLELTGGPGTLIARTDGNGAFGFSGLPPGQYQLSVTCDGFIRQDLPKKIVLGRGQQAGNILFQLEPAPTAAGRVLDMYGEPITNVMIEALRRTYDVRGNPKLSRVATALTNDLGEYRIFWLDPGDYFFYASSPPPDSSEEQTETVVAPTYFPGVNTPEDARALRLDIGREVRVDFRLRPAGLWPITGHTMNGTTGRPVGATITLIPPGQNPNTSRYRAQSSASGFNPGEFSMERVAPGSYVIMAKSATGDPELTAFQRIELRPVLVAPINGYTVTLSLAAPISVRGQLYIESQEALDLRRVSIALLSVDPDTPSPQTGFAGPNGQFAINRIFPGDYVLEITNLPQDFYLKTARFGEAGLDKPLAIGMQSSSNPLQILLGSDGGRLQAESQPGAQFVLVPDAARRGRMEQFRVAVAGDDGRTVIRGIPPGNYKLFAWKDLEPNAYLNTDYLQAYEDRGVPLKISAGDNPPVAVRVIPKE